MNEIILHELAIFGAENNVSHFKNVELDDDSYGIYNFNWGYYLQSLRLFCTTGVGKPFQPPA